MNQRGMSHIEVILATLMFVGFIVFAFYFFTPMSKNSIADSSVDYLIRELENNLTVEVQKYSVILNSDSKTFVNVSINNIGISDRVRVEDYHESVLSSSIENGDIYFDRAGNEYAIIYLSEDLPYVTNSISSNELEQEPPLGASSVSNMLSIIRLKEIVNIYNSNYEELKGKLNIPSQTDFSFYFQYSNGTTIRVSKKIPENVNIYSDQKYYEVLNAEGSRGFGKLVVLTW